jgi:hypothetical protein
MRHQAAIARDSPPSEACSTDAAPSAQSAHLRTAIVVVLALFAAAGAQAEQGVLDALGWVKQSPGSELDASTRIRVLGNSTTAKVSSSGGKAGVVGNIGARLELIATAQANGAGLGAMAARNTQIQILQNQVNGLVNAIGGAASANSVLISGGAGRKTLADSQFNVSGNTAGAVDAVGVKGSVLLGAGSLQLPGRAAANAVLIDESEVRRTQLASSNNRTDRTSALGGAALANSLTAARSKLDDVQIYQAGNSARDVRAGGGSAGLGYGALASADLTGVASANSVTIAGSQARGLRSSQSGNTAQAVSALGGSALANTFNLSDYTGTLQQYRVVQSDNRARDVLAHGGDASVLGGALADVRMSASALANAVSIQGGTLGGATQHALSSNSAEGVRATGGGAAANSVWLQGARSERTPVSISGNTALRVETAGGAGNVGGGLVGAFERNSRALANSVMADGGSRLSDAPVALAGNEAHDLGASGGAAVASSVLASGNSELRGVRTTLSANRAQGVRSTGFEASVGAGLLGTASQQSIALANSLAAEGSTVDAGRMTIAGNQATDLNAQGGKLLANSVSVEKNGGGASRLSGDVMLSGNTASQVTTGAGGMAGPGRLFSQERRARAATNAVALVDNAETDAASPITLADNSASKIAAVGGTALVNALGAYRGARIAASPITLAGNRANDVTAGGSNGQVLGAGGFRNGILVANGVYMEAEGAARLTQTPVTIAGNTAERLRANGGRVTANALSVNGRGDAQGSSVVIAANRATDVRSEGDEGTVLGHAVIDRGVGSAVANAVQVLGSLRSASAQLAGNTADRVVAEKGLAAANSLVAEESSDTSAVQTALMANQSADVNASDGKTALAASVNNLGRIDGGSVAVLSNRASAQARGGDALAASLRNRQRGSIASSQIAIVKNQAAARDGGIAGSVDNDGTIANSQITILGNAGEASSDGVANSVVNRGTLKNAQIAILGNRGKAAGGTLNSVVNRGQVGASQIMIAGNNGTANRGGTLNSVVNERSGTMAGAKVLLAGNSGSVSGDGIVNSVVNHGTLNGQVAVLGNTGSATDGGTVNSLVNHGAMTGKVLIAGNQGTAAAGGITNSVINRGVIAGTVAIVGGVTAGSVPNPINTVRTAGAIVRSAALASPGVVSRSVTVGPAAGAPNL